MKKLISLVLALAMLCVCFAALAESPEGYPEVIEGVSFAGAKIWIADYWSGTSSSEHKSDPNDEEQALYDYRAWINETYNADVYQLQDGDWGTCAEQLINFVGTPDGSLRLYIIEPGKVGSLMANGVIAPWKSEYVDLEDEKWNKADLSFMTKNGEVYGVYAGNSEPRQCLYFNKRVLEEANIDWDSIYDMQANGTWTWDVFEDMLKQLTKDTDNDGVVDIWGLTGSADDMYVTSVFSNGGSFFDFNEAGELYPSMGSEEALSALAWAKSLYENYFYQQPADGNWDYYKEAFKAGNIGFYMYQCYGGFNDNAELANMEDEWGCVAFPVPHAGDNYVTVVSDNMVVIPACYDAETASKLALIYDLWSNPTPGYDDEDSWIGNKYNFTDERAVDETYAMLRESEHCVTNKVLYLGTQNDVLGNSLLWALGGSTPAELVEAGMPEWQARCDTFNGK